MAKSKIMNKSANNHSSNMAANDKDEEGFFKSLGRELALVIIFFTVFTSFGYASFHIPSGSMEPTLEVGDRIIVSKFSYGYSRFSLPFNAPLIPNRIFAETPKRGDIAVFTKPDRDTDFIKRTIGLPGDTVQIRRGRLFINGDLIPRKFIRNVTYISYDGQDIRAKEYEETLPNGVSYRIYERSDDNFFDDTPVYTVPEGMYFMMGDNRDGSSDSREMVDMGFIPLDYFVGKALVTTFSLYDCDQGKPIGCAGFFPYERFFNYLY